MDYSQTVNLLQTNFPMKADLSQREPLLLQKWDEMKLYAKMNEHGAGKPVFLLHDGPPYANGVIHMGHALNKTLKDFVIKYKRLAGFHSPYKPGWDCHGLPIEHQLFKEMGKNKHQVTRIELREKATVYAQGFVDKQREEFKRLGILGDWAHPYLTLTDDYVASIVETFFDLRDKGFVGQGLKPGYWCAFDETALAEAEVEYADKKSDAVFVRFLVKPASLPEKMKDKLLPLTASGNNLYVLIWTTTPWTLPANVGLAFHPDEEYVALQAGAHNYLVAAKLREALGKKIGETGVVAGGWRGRDFTGLKAVNPLHGRESQAVTAGYVTMDDGTGIVHIAPGHGVEDFAVGQQFGLETVCPVNERGQFDETVRRPELVGKHVLKDANKEVMALLGENLVLHYSFSHSYPHCWRCKNPIIFRATKQWFLKISDEFRQKILQQIDAVRWEPDYGIHRIKGMVEQRPDWCLSRQRHWGAPIAVFLCRQCKEPLQDKKLNQEIVEFLRVKGVNAWYQISPDEFLKGMNLSCAHCQATSFDKETDILDVWFDSGVSWRAVVERFFSNPKPQTVMYLEGSDQHRGWFQTSLIPSVALQGRAPYDVVLTHGFVVDGKGHKMSKSLGNVIAPQEIIKLYGADVLRLWVAMSDYREDVRLSQDIVKQVIDMYRKFRNTLRFLLQNTADFKFSEHAVEFDSLEEIDRWILVRFEDVKKKVRAAFEAYQFHGVLTELNKFASVELSGFYLDAHKDRLYCEAPDSPKRRSAQTALYHLTHGLTVLLSPLLSFTAEEAYLELRAVSHPQLKESVFLEDLGSLAALAPDAKLDEKWLSILDVRRLVNDVLDQQRKAGRVKSSQEAAVDLNAGQLEAHKPVLAAASDWPFLLQVAEVRIDTRLSSDGPAVSIEPTRYLKCERCWRHRSDVGEDRAHPALCRRCVDVVK